MGTYSEFQLDKNIYNDLNFLQRFNDAIEREKLNPQLQGISNAMIKNRNGAPLFYAFRNWVGTKMVNGLFLSGRAIQWNTITTNNEIPYKCPSKDLNLPPILCGKKRVEFLPIVYDYTQDEDVKKVIKYYSLITGNLNEYYYIEENGMYRGEKYKQNLPLDIVGKEFPDPFVFTVAEIVSIGLPTAPKPTENNIIPDQPIPKPMPPVLIIDPTLGTTTPGTTTPGPTTPGTTTPGTTTPGPTINKNILIIGGLIGLFLLTKK